MKLLRVSLQRALECLDQTNLEEQQEAEKQEAAN
jgi:hypothetical protein